MAERLIKAGHRRRYIREVDREEESTHAIGRITTGSATPLVSRPAINYIQGGSLDDQYRLKLQQKKLLRATIVKARVNALHISGSREETKPIDGPISFPLVNLNRVIMPHYDALVLTLCINGFDVHKGLVDTGRTVDLLQLPAFNQRKLSSQMLIIQTNPLWFQRRNNHYTGRHHTSYTSRASNATGFILSCRPPGTI